MKQKRITANPEMINNKKMRINGINLLINRHRQLCA